MILIDALLEYTVHRQLPTIAKLRESLKDDIKFNGSGSLLRNIVKELGFKWKRSQGRRKVIIERYDIVDLRCRYLKKSSSTVRKT
jgi:hypothetical protein